jgi:transcription elongation GreA/GreB family factor
MALVETAIRDPSPTLEARPLEPVAQAMITREGERLIGAELSRLRRQLEVEFPERLRNARAFGDIGENDDYLQIKEEEAVVASRIERLQLLLDSATVADGKGQAGAVAIGSLVEVEDVASGEVRVHRLTGGYERLGRDDVSASSPIGRALSGCVIGDEATVELPDGRQRTLRITGVRAASR